MAPFLFGPFVQAEEPAPPARAVRLALVEGEVQLSQGSQVLADPAVANAPLFEGSQVATAEDGRAEIQFEDGSVARLSPNSSLTLKVLRPQNGLNQTEIVLESGLAYFELQAGNSAGQIRVRFGDSVATASGFTVLRINVDAPPGEIAVFSGNTHLERGNALALDLHGGESAVLKAADLSGYNLSESIEPDSWDTWNADRDQVLQAEHGSRTAATKSFADSSNPAWADLDAYGNWYNVPDQGYVWSPYDSGSADWDPYGNGNWMWTPGYGYIWVSGDPWGYMPFQCGHWNYYDAFGWGWAPGMGYCQPWWGGGMGWGFNIGLAPSRYRFPIRPRPRPRPGQPRGPFRNSLNGGEKLSPHPLIAVNRRTHSGSAGLQLRDRNAPVTIAGHTVQPLRPLSPRPQYGRSAAGSMNRPQPVYQGTRPAGVPSRPIGSIFGGSRPANAPRASSGSTSHASAPSHASFGGSSSGGHFSGGSSSGGGGSHGGGGSSGGGSHH
jgi:uncharacterized membrane protein YgcG